VHHRGAGGQVELRALSSGTRTFRERIGDARCITDELAPPGLKAVVPAGPKLCLSERPGLRNALDMVHHPRLASPSRQPQGDAACITRPVPGRRGTFCRRDPVRPP
jgi:hypothetical protein